MKKVVRSIFLIGTVTLVAVVDKESIHHYVWANYQQFQNNLPQAKERYETLLQKENSPYVYKGYIHLLQEGGLWKPIAGFIPGLDSIFADDLEMQMIFAQALEHTGDHNGCDERLIKINEKHKNNQDIAFATVQCYLRRKEPENALQVINDFLNNVPSRPNNFVFYFIKSQIYVQMNKKNEALESVKKSIELYPKFDKSWLMFAILEEQAGQVEQAIKGYTHFLAETNDSAEMVKKHVMELALKHDVILHNNMADKKKSAFEQALICAQNSEHDKALSIVESCLQQKPDDTKYRLFKLDTLAALKKDDDLLNALKGWILEVPSHDFWYKTLHMAAKQKPYQQGVIAILKQVEMQHPTNALPVLYQADLYIRAKKEAAALTYLRKGLNLTNNKETKAKILYQIALIHYDKRQFQLMKKALLTAQQLQTSFLPPLNLLAYHYASKENNVDQALALIEQVVSQDAANPHYLDTKAFILYKNGDYDSSVAILEKIVDQAPKDVTILRHLAKALNKQGEKQRANATIQRAIQFAIPTHEKQKLQRIAQQWNKK